MSRNNLLDSLLRNILNLLNLFLNWYLNLFLNLLIFSLVLWNIFYSLDWYLLSLNLGLVFSNLLSCLLWNILDLVLQSHIVLNFSFYRNKLSWLDRNLFSNSFLNRDLLEGWTSWDSSSYGSSKDLLLDWKTLDLLCSSLYLIWVRSLISYGST